jgi:hypothetical protein
LLGSRLFGKSCGFSKIPCLFSKIVAETRNYLYTNRLIEEKNASQTLTDAAYNDVNFDALEADDYSKEDSKLKK